MKKLIILSALIMLVLALIMLVSVLAGCAPKIDTYEHTVTGLLPGEDCHRKLLLQDEVSLKFFFTTDDAPESILYEDETLPVTRELDGRFSVIIPDVPVEDFDKQICFDFGHISVETSVLSYIRDCLEIEENEAVRDVVKSLYKSYLHSR